MISETQVGNVVGSTAYTQDGDKVGKVGQLFLDDQTGQPEFVTVNTGLLGTSESFVPVSQASFESDRLLLPFSKDKIKDAPNVDLGAGGHLDASEERRLYDYYGMGGNYDSGYQTTDTTGTADYERSAGHDTSGPNTDDAMTRSEEQLHVGKTSQEAGRVKLRKYVTTETETATVPVAKERAVVHTEPITDGNIGNATSGPAISEEEHEVVLQEERPVVEKTAQPVERVRLGTETEVEQHTVSEEVRKENIEVEGDADRRI